MCVIMNSSFFKYSQCSEEESVSGRGCVFIRCCCCTAAVSSCLSERYSNIFTSIVLFCSAMMPLWPPDLSWRLLQPLRTCLQHPKDSLNSWKMYWLLLFLYKSLVMLCIGTAFLGSLRSGFLPLFWFPVLHLASILCQAELWMPLIKDLAPTGF